MSISEHEIEQLISEAIAARAHAQIGYFKIDFPVGAALVTNAGEIFSGFNVEEPTMTATVHAEVMAVILWLHAMATRTGGDGEVVAIAVVTDTGDFPCGPCRQFFTVSCRPELLVIAAKPDGEYRTSTMEKLLPESFHLKPSSLR